MEKKNYQNSELFESFRKSEFQMRSVKSLPIKSLKKKLSKSNNSTEVFSPLYAILSLIILSHAPLDSVNTVFYITFRAYLVCCIYRY